MSLPQLGQPSRRREEDEKSVGSFSNEKSPPHLESGHGAQRGHGVDEEEIANSKLDKQGLPLIPQPDDNADDPLNWPQWIKLGILFQISLLAFFGTFNLAVGNPAFVEIGEHFGFSPVTASYQATIGVALAGVGSFLWVPLANVYGRRPVLLFCTLATTAATIGSAKCSSYGTLILARALSGLFISAPNALGPGLVADIFFLHERGTMMGIFTVFLTQGPHLASLPGGFLAQYVGWRWTLWLPAIIQGVLFIGICFFLPETLYLRTSGLMKSDETISEQAKIHTTKQSIRRRLRIWGHHYPGRKLQLISFVRPFQMVKYPSLMIPGFYYGLSFSLGSVLPAFTSSKLFAQFYHYRAARTGVALGLSTFIGGGIGELAAGPVIDRIMRAQREKRGGKALPETRLHGLWPGAILLPAGLILFGCSIHFHDHISIVGPTAGAAITCMANQIITTPIYSYVTDCYKPQATECAQMLNFIRQELAMTVSFWAIRYGNKVGYQWSGTTYALITLLFFLPVIFMMFQGQKIRERVGQPNFNKGN